MLTLQLTDDYSIEKQLYGDTIPGEHVALMDDGAPIGMCVFNFIDNKIIIQRVAILENVRGKSFGDFFIRALLFKFSLSKVVIVVPFAEPKLVKFGFKQLGDSMVAEGSEIVFPSSCSSKKL